ncbi:hypothetical protein [Streptococcus sinensis]|uniref:Uncharacterized protein n=1 Tax=Streptococcus sinensis TaxID=176090 RepID=A0A0A0DJN4_9STRE|nr:hypothetical protein [Streptococcus sinensis]KGM37202.1 hypothetical protein SSIN_1068 [Streptococcus sinensis]
MPTNRFTKDRKSLLIVLLLAITTSGGILLFSMLGKFKEERRNREYEVSLVKALKNSYEGIEEVKITNPNFTEILESWSCDVDIRFKDGEKIVYGINHRLEFSENYEGVMKGKTDEEIDQQWERLQSHRGKTSSKILVIYSNSERGEV